MVPKQCLREDIHHQASPPMLETRLSSIQHSKIKDVSAHLLTEVFMISVSDPTHNPNRSLEWVVFELDREDDTRLYVMSSLCYGSHHKVSAFEVSVASVIT